MENKKKVILLIGVLFLAVICSVITIESRGLRLKKAEEGVVEYQEYIPETSTSLQEFISAAIEDSPAINEETYIEVESFNNMDEVINMNGNDFKDFQLITMINDDLRANMEMDVTSLTLRDYGSDVRITGSMSEYDGYIDGWISKDDLEASISIFNLDTGEVIYQQVYTEGIKEIVNYVEDNISYSWESQ